MTQRVVAVLLTTPAPGALPEQLRLAMLEDVYETAAQLELVEAAVAVAADDPLADRAGDVTWPGTTVLTLAAGTSPLARRALAALAELAGAGQVTVVAADAPDLPGLLVGKLHRALGSADVAVLPAAGGGLVAAATHAPLPPWLGDDVPDLDDPDPLAALRAAAPRRTSVSVGPGWHRVRSADDVRHLDPGLEGWEVTRAELGR